MTKGAEIYKDKAAFSKRSGENVLLREKEMGGMKKLLS